MKLSLITLLAFFFLASSCSEEDKARQEFDKIVFEYHDSSVAPEYHRSYKITATAKKGQMVVDSYGDTLGLTNFTLGEKRFKDLKSLMCKVGEEDGLEVMKDCNGCWTKVLRLYKGGKKTFELKWTGGDPSPELEAAIDYLESNIEYFEHTMSRE